MDFTEEQKDKIRAWLEEGASLSQVQTRLKDEFGINMTYLDVRLAVLDIGASVKDPEQPRQNRNRRNRRKPKSAQNTPAEQAPEKKQKPAPKAQKPQPAGEKPAEGGDKPKKPNRRPRYRRRKPSQGGKSGS